MGLFSSNVMTSSVRKYGEKSKNTDIRIVHFYDRYEAFNDLMKFLEKEQIQSFQIIDIEANYIESKDEPVVDLIYKIK